MLAVVFVLIGLAALVLMIMGLFKPSLVVRWGSRKTRSMVLIIYGGLFIALFICLGMTGNPDTSIAPVVKAAESSVKVNNSESSQVIAVAEASEKERKMKYANGGAKKLIENWLGEHEFPSYPININQGTSDGSMFELDGKKYHMFTITGLSRSVDILVDPYTGEMFFYDTGLQPKPIDKWYLEYKASHKNDFGKRIDDNFMWVEKPVGQNGAIVGKVKNLTNNQFRIVTVSFALLDDNGNQIGTANQVINNLGAGNTWSFAIPVYQTNVAGFKFSGINAM